VPKFSDIQQGTRARLKGVVLPGLDGSKMVFDLRLIDTGDDEEILRLATERAEALKVEAKRGTVSFDFICHQFLVLFAATDSDSPLEKPEQFFGSIADVRRATDRDGIAYLVAKQLAYQDTLSPLKHTMSVAERQTHIFQLAAGADGDDDPLVGYAPSVRLTFERTMARELLASPLSKWPRGGGVSGEGSPSSSPASTPSGSSLSESDPAKSE
jgi:hypothetical protein